MCTHEPRLITIICSQWNSLDLNCELDIVFEIKCFFKCLIAEMNYKAVFFPIKCCKSYFLLLENQMLFPLLSSPVLYWCSWAKSEAFQHSGSTLRPHSNLPWYQLRWFYLITPNGRHCQRTVTTKNNIWANIHNFSVCSLQFNLSIYWV